MGEKEYIIQSHYYNKNHNFDLSFKKFIKEGVEQFIENFNKETDNLWIVEVDQQLKGSIVISQMNGFRSSTKMVLG